MKTLLRTLPFFCMIWLINACQEEDPNPADLNPASGEIQFAFSSVSKIKSNEKVAVSEEFPSGAYLSIKLLSAGDSVDQALSLIKFGDGYISEPLTLMEAEYEISDFMVMNEEGEAIYATPKEGSPLASHVDDPLPVNFTVQEGELTNLNMEVVDVTGHVPEDFGYASFQIEIVSVSQVSLSVFIQKNGELQLTDAQGYLLHEGDTIVNESLESGVNAIDFVGSTEGNYSLVVIKSGYDRYTKDFTLQELLENSPIKVILAPAFTLVTPVNGTFMFNLKGSPEMTLDVNWGDGNTETFIAGPETLYLEHPYEITGSKFVTITGDITLIEEVSFFYGDANTSSIHINHLTNLTRFEMGFTESPAEIDFSDNLKLKRLALENPSIQNIDISNNVELEVLNITFTSIPSIDISNNMKLEFLSIAYTSIPSIDISNHFKIKGLRIEYNDALSSAEKDKLIADLLNHSASASPPDYPRLFSFSSNPNAPSATGMANLEILRTEYDWDIHDLN